MATMLAPIAFPGPEQAEAGSVSWQQIQDVPCSLAAEIPVSGFSVRDLLLLQAGSVVNSKQSTRARAAVRANGSLLAWAEFEVSSDHLAVRLTDLG
jgi:flagellar motor switch/type III secretory pathway protein FliN